MNILNNKQFFNEDLESLKHLGQIKRGDKIDIYENGRLSTPYSTGLLASGWRTARYLSGYAHNRDDIPKIKTLMERSLFAYGKGKIDDEDLHQAIKGLDQLKMTYDSEKKFASSQKIKEIIHYINHQLTQLKKGEFESLVLPEELKHFQNLEASVLSEEKGTRNGTDGMRYFIDKIEGFLKLAELSPEEKNFMSNIKEQLSQALHFYTLKNSPFMIGDNLKKRVNEVMELVQTIPETVLHSLDHMDSIMSKNIGILIPLTLQMEMNESMSPEGHVVAVSICKEEDGNYTLVSHDAGEIFLIKSLALQINKTHLFQLPVSTYGKTVVEFGPLTREEAKQFITQAYDKSFYIAKDKKEYETVYKEIFSSILSQEKKSRVPDRRFQDMGNCAFRSIKEWMIFCLQKSQQVQLANKLQNFATIRDSRSLPQDEIKPLFTP